MKNGFKLFPSNNQQMELLKEDLEDYYLHHANPSHSRDSAEHYWHHINPAPAKETTSGIPSSLSTIQQQLASQGISFDKMTSSD